MPASQGLTPIDPEAVAEVQRAAPPDDLLTLVAETFEALADPTRAHPLRADPAAAVRAGPRHHRRHQRVRHLASDAPSARTPYRQVATDRECHRVFRR